MAVEIKTVVRCLNQLGQAGDSSMGTGQRFITSKSNDMTEHTEKKDLGNTPQQHQQGVMV